MTTLYIMAGLPASGKSHIAESICKRTGAEIICKDDLREQLCGDASDQSKNKEIHQIYLQKIKEELKTGRSVIADATNIYVGNRINLINLTKDIPCRIKLHIATKSQELCLIDNMKRNRHVPESIIKEMNQKFEYPDKKEKSRYSKVVYHKSNRERSLFGQIMNGEIQNKNQYTQNQDILR